MNKYTVYCCMWVAVGIGFIAHPVVGAISAVFAAMCTDGLK
jgi:hypothetical protein